VPTVLPDPIAVSKLLTSLMDRSVAVKRITQPVAPKGVVVVAAYATDDGACGGLCWLDLAAAGSAAAALTLTPVALVDESVRGSRLASPLDENVREVLNICATLFTGVGSHRVYLSEVYLPPAKPPATLANAIARATPQATVQIDMTITGYRPGKMGFVSV
jgi:hypothetical protein